MYDDELDDLIVLIRDEIRRQELDECLKRIDRKIEIAISQVNEKGDIDGSIRHIPFRPITTLR